MHVNTLSVRQVKKRRERTKRQRERERIRTMKSVKKLLLMESRISGDTPD